MRSAVRQQGHVCCDHSAAGPGMLTLSVAAVCSAGLCAVGSSMLLGDALCALLCLEE